MSEPVPLPADKATAALAALDALLAPFHRSDAPGLVIGIAQQGRLLYRRAFGMASLEMGVALAPTSRMRIASTSKHFTAMGILLLVEDGLVALDAMAQAYLPELPTLSDKGPTVAQLLAHTSGWRGHDELWVMAHGLTFCHPGPGLPAMARQGELNFEPGTQMVYSNGGYHLLAKIIERVSGLSYDAFLKARLFGPLGMPDTASVATDLDVLPGLAGLYMPAADGGWQRGLYPCELDGGGSLVSTVDDMLRWLAHLRAPVKTVGSQQSWDALSAPTTLASGSTVTYGYGLARHPYRGVEIVHHAGAVLGATSQMLSVPSHGLDIVILVNGAPIAPSSFACKVVDLFLEDQLAPHETRPQAADFPGLVGQRYHAPATGKLISFADVAGKLAMSWQGNAALPMHHGEGKLWLGLQDLPVNDLALQAADLDPAKPNASLTLFEGGEPRRFERLPETAPDAATLAPQLCGDYRSPDLDASARMELADGKLLLTVRGRYGHHAAVLDILSADVMVLTSTDPLLARMGRSILNVERQGDKVVGLRMATLRTHHIHLIREETRA